MSTVARVSSLPRVALARARRASSSRARRAVVSSPSSPPSRVVLARGGMDLDALDLDALMPDTIEGDLEGLQEEAGATFDDEGIPLDYGDVDAELETLRSSVGIVDRGGRWRILRLGGPAAIPALEAAGASPDAIAALLALQPGQGAALPLADDAVAMAHVQGGGLLLVAPAAAADAVADAAGEDAMDLADMCALVSLVGPNAADLLASAGVAGVMAGPPGTHEAFGFEGRPVVAAHGAELGVPSANFVVDEGVAGLVWAAMTGKGAKPVGTRALDAHVAEARE
jgi:glycine cleavage system aminomethyltransferase T